MNTEKCKEEITHLYPDGSKWKRTKKYKQQNVVCREFTDGERTILVKTGFDDDLITDVVQLVSNTVPADKVLKNKWVFGIYDFIEDDTDPDPNDYWIAITSKKEFDRDTNLDSGCMGEGENGITEQDIKKLYFLLESMDIVNEMENLYTCSHKVDRKQMIKQLKDIGLVYSKKLSDMMQEQS